MPAFLLSFPAYDDILSKINFKFQVTLKQNQKAKEVCSQQRSSVADFNGSSKLLCKPILQVKKSEIL